MTLTKRTMRRLAKARGLPIGALLNLTAMGMVSKHTVATRIVEIPGRTPRVEVLHATKGWRSRSAGSLQALGAL